MPNYYLSVLYKHIIQVKNKNVGLKVGGHKHTFAPPIKKVGGHMPPLPPRFLRQWHGISYFIQQCFCVVYYLLIYLFSFACLFFVVFVFLLCIIDLLSIF